LSYSHLIFFEVYSTYFSKFSAEKLSRNATEYHEGHVLRNIRKINTETPKVLSLPSIALVLKGWV